MGTTKNTILLNGKLYDARSGVQISARGTKSIDGFVGTKTMAATRAAGPSRPAKPATHTTAKHHPRHKAQHAKTLMRSAVSKPANKPKLAKASVAGTKITDIAPLQASQNERLTRASQTPRSKLINRFGTSMDVHAQSITKMRPIGVKTPPHYATTASRLVATPTAAFWQQNTEPTDIFSAGLERATSHTQKTIKKHRFASKKQKGHSKPVGLAVTLLILASLAGIIVWQNLANIEVRIASHRAGIHAKLPGYKPSGFSFRSLAYRQGLVTINFASNSDARYYSVTERVSNWNSETLHTSFVDGNGPASTVATNGRTIYFYGATNATWVDGGIWYQIEGNSSLDTNQLIKIANSM